MAACCAASGKHLWITQTPGMGLRFTLGLWYGALRMEKRHVHLFGNTRGRGGAKAALGEIKWDARKRLVFNVSDGRLARSLERCIRSRIQRGEYYVAAAVRTGARPSGLRFDRIDDAVPEVLRCIAADRELWGRSHAGFRITPVYQEGA